jgi:hypothetical protein
MKDNFDLKKFLTENKTIEKSNPFLNESYDEFQRDDKGSKGVTAKDTGEKDAYGAGFEAGKRDALRAKIREMIISELQDYQDFDEEGVDMGEEDLEDIFRGEYSIDNPDFDQFGDDELYEAKKDEEETPEEDVEAEEEIETEEDIDVTDEETPEEEGGMDVPEMEGDEGEILNHLMKALGMAKSAGDEKLIKQIGNTVTFLTRQYISGE